MISSSKGHKVPKGYYTKEGVWAKIVDGLVRVGITDYLQKQLGEVIFVKLPRAGEFIEQFEVFSQIESLKAVCDLHSPVSGFITKVNEELEDRPDIINSSPYTAWIIEVQPIKLEEELKNLLNKDLV